MPKRSAFVVPSLAVSQAVGFGSAIQGVSQAAAAVVVDGSTYLGSVTTVSSAAIATMTAGMVAQVAAGGGPNSPDKYQDGLQAVQKNVQDTAETFTKIGTSAATVLKAFKGL